MTFSIVARSPKTGELGIAVTTAWFAVGSTTILVRPGIGAVTCQAIPSPALRERCLRFLASGLQPEEAVSEALSTEHLPDYRQVGLLDLAGRTAGYTGTGCEAGSGHIAEHNYVITGNCLQSLAVLRAVERSWLSTSEIDSPMAERLLNALEAGQNEGGDKRGTQSAALFVANENPLLNVDLRVDDSTSPLIELRRLLQLFRDNYEPVYKNL